MCNCQEMSNPLWEFVLLEIQQCMETQVGSPIGTGAEPHSYGYWGIACSVRQPAPRLGAGAPVRENRTFRMALPELLSRSGIRWHIVPFCCSFGALWNEAAGLLRRSTRAKISKVRPPRVEVSDEAGLK